MSRPRPVRWSWCSARGRREAQPLSSPASGPECAWCCPDESRPGKASGRSATDERGSCSIRNTPRDRSAIPPSCLLRSENASIRSSSRRLNFSWRLATNAGSGSCGRQKLRREPSSYGAVSSTIACPSRRHEEHEEHEDRSIQRTSHPRALRVLVTSDASRSLQRPRPCTRWPPFQPLACSRAPGLDSSFLKRAFRSHTRCS